MQVTTTWAMRWNDIMRDVLYPDAELRSLMLIPENVNIVQWKDKYFVDEAQCSVLVEDEDVRVLWYEEASGQTGNPNVLKRKICFDIYVRREHLNDVTNDIFQSRARMVSQKIQELLSGREQVGRICFAYSDDYALGTKMVGYVRHHLVMTYMASHR